jgi:hypothetical protein
MKKNEVKLMEENEELKAEKMNLQELSELISELANPLQELKKELGLENKILVPVK